MIFTAQLNATVIDPFKTSVSGNHEIILLNYGLASLEQRLEMIEHAKKSIDVETYIFNTDTTGQIISQALIKKAREGVKVRILTDWLISHLQFSPFYAYEMQKFGIEVKYFNTSSIIHLSKIQYRNHRKALLIDGEAAIVGGRNIADEYFDLSEKFNFLDRDLMVSGPIVNYIQQTFNTIWNSELSVSARRPRQPKLSDALYLTENNGVDEIRFHGDLLAFFNSSKNAGDFLSIPNSQIGAIRAFGKSELSEEYKGTCQNMSFYSEYPIIGRKNRSERIIKYDMEKRILNSKVSILFDTPYFILDKKLNIILREALEKNVMVDFLTNSLISTDDVMMYSVFDSLIKKWIESGLRANIYKGKVPNNYLTLTQKISQAIFGIHAKSYIFDKKDVVIGSYNIDPHSANFNLELNLVCTNNTELADFVAADIRGKIKGSIFIDSEKTIEMAKFYNKKFLKLIEYYIFKIPSNIFSYLL